jgi:hypothetical protein
MPDAPSESTMRNIRSLCQQLADRHGLDAEARDELCGHFEDKLSAYLSGTLPITEEDALHLVRAHFGDADRISRRISAARAGGFFSWGINHARVYTVVLIVLTAFQAVSLPVVYVFIARSRVATGIQMGRIPNAWLPIFAGMGSAYLLLMITTLALRRLRPTAGRRLTRILNYALLIAPPFGTSLGLYGLLSLDRRAPARSLELN